MGVKANLFNDATIILPYDFQFELACSYAGGTSNNMPGDARDTTDAATLKTAGTL